MSLAAAAVVALVSAVVVALAASVVVDLAASVVVDLAPIVVVVALVSASAVSDLGFVVESKLIKVPINREKVYMLWSALDLMGMGAANKSSERDQSAYLIISLRRTFTWNGHETRIPKMGLDSLYDV